MRIKTLNRFISFAATLILAACLPAGGALIINPTWDVSLTNNLSATDLQSAKDAFNYAAQQITTAFDDPVQINITVKATPGTGTLGASSTFLLGILTYAQTRSALGDDAKSGNDVTANSSLGPADPTSGGQFFVARAQAKALGILASDATIDGTFTFGAGHSYTYNPLDRAVTGKFDFIGVAAHEITEIMGRIGGLGTDFGTGGTPDYLLYDLFRYSAAGTRSLVDAAGNYFSIDGGDTNLKEYNHFGANGGDAADWASGANDSFNAFSSSGVMNDITAVDYLVMDVIGFDLVPEPVNVALGVFVGIFSLAGLARWRTARSIRQLV